MKGHASIDIIMYYVTEVPIYFDLWNIALKVLVVLKQQPELHAAFPISQTSASKCELAGNKRFPVDRRTDPTNRCSRRERIWICI